MKDVSLLVEPVSKVLAKYPHKHRNDAELTITAHYYEDQNEVVVEEELVSFFCEGNEHCVPGFKDSHYIAFPAESMDALTAFWAANRK